MSKPKKEYWEDILDAFKAQDAEKLTARERMMARRRARYIELAAATDALVAVLVNKSVWNLGSSDFLIPWNDISAERHRCEKAAREAWQTLAVELSDGDLDDEEITQ